VVIGGGVIGLSVAWQAASSGLAVTLIDPRPGRGATWAAAGMLGPTGEADFGEEALTRLNVFAARRWPAFAESLEHASSRSVGYVRSGTVMVAADASDRQVIDGVLGFQQDLGLTTRRLSARECRECEPLLAPDIRGGADFPHDHQVDNRLLVESLLCACESAGVTVITDQVTEIIHDRRGASGVRVDGRDSIACGSVVVAAGCRSGQIGGIPDAFLPPVRPVKGLTVRLQAPRGGPTLRRTVRGLVHGRRCYLVPRTGGAVVIGATVEEQGFDLTVQAGSVHDLLDDARTLMPAVDDYELVEMTPGLRPGTPDNAPIVGATRIDGLIVATGHYRNGILLAPVTADAVVALLAGGFVPPELSAFGPERFVGSGASVGIDSTEPARTQ
jgi:glycine oxidase